MSSATGNPPTGVEHSPPEQAPPEASAAGTREGPALAAQEQGTASEPAARSCSHCGNALAPGQEWCLHCGAATRGSLENPRWRSTTAIAVGVAVLALGAAAAAYAALEQHAPKPAVRTIAATTPPATTPTTPAAPAGTPKASVPATPAHPKLPIPLQKTKLPKIPLTAPVTPTKTAGKGNTSTGEGNTGKSEGENKGSEGAGNGESSEPAALVLDTDAASTYNPYGLPASDFGDASLVIDGATSTAWSAEVDPTTAPAMEEGVLLNLNSAQKLSAMKLVTQTTGMTVQVYGSTLGTPPESIVSSGWTALSAPRVVKKHDVRIKLGHQKKGFRYLTLWISKAPAGDTSSTPAPARVYVNELEVFPAS